jgi:hypothetical protein
VSPSPQDRAARIAAELAGLGLALPGTLAQRRVRCSWPGCRCHADPPQLHGPYWHWTRKRAGKTISRLVPDNQVDNYRQWLDNHRRLRELITELEDLTLAVADERSGHQARTRRTRQTPAEPGKHPHNTVDPALLTRGRNVKERTSPQVKPKCESLAHEVFTFG